MIVTTEWHRCKGCLKLQVFFRKRATNYHDGARPTKIMQNEQQMSSIMIIRGSFAEKKSCRPFSAKQPLIIMMELICGKRPMKTRHPLYFHHPTVYEVAIRHLSKLNTGNQSEKNAFLEAQFEHNPHEYLLGDRGRRPSFTSVTWSTTVL